MTMTKVMPRIEVSTLGAWLDSVVDFRPYLKRLIQKYEETPIPKYYVDLACIRIEVRNGTIVRDNRKFKPLDTLVDQWVAESVAGHLSILGDFGTGKTWFARRYAYKKALEYLAHPTTSRIPILFDLSDFEHTQGIKDSIIHHLMCYGVTMRYPVETFNYLNEQGKLLHIFDSFDQMEQRADAHWTTVQNFWELLGLLRGKSKMVLMCRTHYFKHLAEEVSVLRPIPKSVKVPIDRYRLLELGTPEGRYRLVHVMALDGNDIKLALRKRIPENYESVYDKMQSIYDLGGLAGRPVLLDLIAKIFPRIENVEHVNQLVLYETYFKDQSERYHRAGVSPITPHERLSFMRHLAWDMFISQKITVPPSMFSQRVRRYFGLPDDEDIIERYERDIRTQLYLVRDDNGNIRFGHESFKEFLIAQRVAEGLREGKDLASMLGGNLEISGQRLYLRGIYKFLKSMHEPGDEEFLLKLVDSPHTWERFLAIYLLGRPKDPGYRSTIIDALSRHVLREPDIMTRRETCFALARLGKEGYLTEFVKEIKQDRKLMEEVYKIGYYDYHQDRGGPVEEMRWRLVNKVDQPARIEYIHFLGEYGNALCISAIEPYLQDPDEDVRLEAQEALEKLRRCWQSA